MTKDEALKMALEGLQCANSPNGDYEDVITAIKEALAQTQEPVAWGVFDDNLHDMFFAKEEAQEMVRLKGDGSTVKPLYTTPPQRTWVGLTYEEETELIRLAHNHAGIRFYIQAAEAKLKEKNNV